MPGKNTKAGVRGKRKTLIEHLRSGTYRPERHGPIPDDLQELEFGPKSTPPKNRPSTLGQTGNWAWKFITDNAAGLNESDFMQIEMASRLFAEYRRVSLLLRKCNPAKDDEQYDTLLKKSLRIGNLLSKLIAQLGLNPAARMKMFSATNVRLGNELAKVDRIKRQEEAKRVEEIKDNDKDKKPSDPVTKTALDLYRPPGVA